MTISERATASPMPEQSGRMLSDEHIQAAFDWLRENSNATSAARAMVIRTEFKMKKVHARLMLRAEGSEWKRKAEATCDDEYERACEAYIRASEEWEKMQDQRNKCQLIIDAWRTQSSNERGIVRAGR